MEEVKAVRCERKKRGRRRKEEREEGGRKMTKGWRDKEEKR